MINLPTIQKIIYIFETLSEYYKKVNGKKENIFHLIDLADLEIEINNICPICGSSDCVRFHNYYRRKVIDIDGSYYEDFPIARFLCRNRGLTFSLLPYQLVPYRKYSLELILLILQLSYQENRSRALDHLGEVGIFSVTYCYIAIFIKIVKESLEKAVISGDYAELNKIVGSKDSEKARLESFMAFLSEFEFSHGRSIIQGPCALGYDFYLRSRGRFLFGTPSQFRGRGS